MSPPYPNRLRQLRGRRFTQEELAEKVGVDPATYRSWEDGWHRPRPANVRSLCKVLGVDEPQLGYLSASTAPTGHVAQPSSTLDGDFAPVTLDLPSAIKASQTEWIGVRRHVGRHMATLAKITAGLYQDAITVGPAPLLTREDWMPIDPIDLSDLGLRWLEGEQRRVVDGTEPEARLALPLRAPGRQFDRYSSAVRYVDKPSLYENRPTYRLLEAKLSSSPSQLSFSMARYFEMVDVSQALAHEMGAAHMRWGSDLSWDRVPFRALVDDPFDLRRRPVQAAINALTIRADSRRGVASFWLHWRDPAKVAVGGGLYSVIPVGVFQPATVNPWDQGEDFDLWRNMAREFSEELLGMPEYDGNAGVSLDYEMWPFFRTLSQARASGSLRVHCLGMGLDPLGLGVDILTAVVIEGELFDDLFRDLVLVNAEGYVIVKKGHTAAAGFPFDEEHVDRFLRSEPMGPGGGAALTLAWLHRQSLLGA